MLKIIKIPHTVLSNKTIPVEKIDHKIKRLVIDMEEALIHQVDPQGVGLAAPQVGSNLSLFIIKPEPDKDTQVFINPKILEKIEDRETHPKQKTAHRAKSKKNDEDEEKLEGCLSIPHIWGPVKRSSRVYVEYQDLTGTTYKKWFSGFRAVIIQHEMDHLSGILFTQRSLEQKTPLYEERDGKLEKIEA